MSYNNINHGVMCNLMRQLLTIILLLNFGLAFGQDFSFPRIDTYGKTIVDFIPQGWILLDSAAGDLNNDQFNDIAFVIQHKDSVSLVKKEDDYTDTVLTQ